MMRLPDLSQVRKSPKSTLVGLCILALAAERGVRFDAGGHLAMSARDWFEVGCGFLTALISAVSEDASCQSEPAQQEQTSGAAEV